ncbi:response regulator [Kineobactrum salinum]|uniref:Response regulator n=1 Tax=Kineobactrum salinum TaxID=2708301 RepID=A0A6C0U5V7_9GAMM|nr:response regulator [Kineobactrum salinum]QIB64834.1 response regulator [Kineobactrum salinum]
MKSYEHVRILLVEDSELDAELTIHALKDGKLANAIDWVKDGQQALDFLFHEGEYSNSPPNPPQLILLDLKMPRVSGIEVLRVIKADSRTRRIPVVIMTSSQEDRDIAEAYDLGVNSYVVKPVDFTAMTNIARQAGYYWLAINKSPVT